MIIDSSLMLVPIGGNLSLVAAAGVNIPTPVPIDILGSGVGTPPANIIGNVTLFGADMGIGDDRPFVQVNIGTAVTTSDSCTLNVAIQGAPDTGTPNYTPGTWQTFSETGPLTAAQLTAGTVIRLDFSAAFPANERPRFYRLLFQVPSGELFTAGTIAAAFITMDRDDYAVKYSPNNYVVK